MRSRAVMRHSWKALPVRERIVTVSKMIETIGVRTTMTVKESRYQT